MTKATRDVLDFAVRPVTDAIITGGSFDGTPIGVTTPSTGFFTNLTTGNLTVNGTSNIGGGNSLPTGPAGGDLGGTYPNPTVTALHLASPLPVAQGGTGNQTGQPSGPAGGDLAGTYPNPILTLANNNVGTFTNPTLTVNAKGRITAALGGTQSGSAVALHRAIFTSGSGTFTIPSTNLFVRVVGGGGGGGANSNGGGGGGGAHVEKFLSGLSVRSTLNYAVGAGGIGVASGAGGNGGASTVTSGTQSISTLTAGGGTGGQVATPGVGGTARGGDLNINGQRGGVDEVTNHVGPGGDTGGFFGLGGAQVENLTTPGQPATGFGGGGGGGDAGFASGAGTGGIIIFDWWA